MSSSTNDGLAALRRRVARRHFLAGWAGLLVFLSLGGFLELLHGVKAGFYLDPPYRLRRELGGAGPPPRPPPGPVPGRLPAPPPRPGPRAPGRAATRLAVPARRPGPDPGGVLPGRRLADARRPVGRRPAGAAGGPAALRGGGPHPLGRLAGPAAGGGRAGREGGRGATLSTAA